MHSFSVTVILPALNEEQSLPNVLRELHSALSTSVPHYEIIIVNDGSTDQTGKIADQFSTHFGGVTVIHHQHRLGLGAAIRSGLSRVKTQFWLWVPTDGQFAPQQLNRLFELASPSKLVLSYLEKDTRPPARRFLSKLYRKILIIGFGHKIRYFNGPVLYPTWTVEASSLISNGYSLTAEILIRALDQPISFAEAPLSLLPRQGDQSKALSLQALREVVTSWTKIWWTLRAKRLFLR